MSIDRTTIEDPKVPSVTFRLPRGYILQGSEGDILLREATVRELTGEEEDILADESLSETKRLHAIIGSCLTRLSDGGDVILTDKNRLLKAAGKFLLSDIVTCMFKIKEATSGTEHRQIVKCPAPDCKTESGKPFKWTAILDLSDFVGSETEGDPLKTTRMFTTKRGNVIEWEMLTGDLSLRKEKMKNNTKDKATLALMARVRKVNNQDVTVEILKKFSSAERTEIRRQFDQEGGMETTFDCVCSNCGHTFKEELHVGSDFFFPSETSED